MVSIYFNEDRSISPPTKEIKMAYDNFAIVVPERNLVYLPILIVGESHSV